MSTPWESPIIRVTTGRLNTVNDSVVGGQASIGSRSKFAGQLGKHLWVGTENIAQMFDSTVGTLYGARYRYVRMRATDDDSPVLDVGQILFWDTQVTNWRSAYQVTRDENLSSTDNAVMIAGIYLGGFEPGNYGFICDFGPCNVMARAVLTAAGAPGSRVYAAGTGDIGSDQGTMDVLTTDSTSLANARYLGVAVVTPVGATATQVVLDFKPSLV